MEPLRDIFKPKNSSFLKSCIYSLKLLISGVILSISNLYKIINKSIFSLNIFSFLNSKFSIKFFFKKFIFTIGVFFTIFSLSINTVLAITNIEDVFSAYIYTGNGVTQTITNGVDIASKGGMIWLKNRDGAPANQNNNIVDSIRGVSSQLITNTTDAVSATSMLASINSNGFSLGAFGPNASPTNYASWSFAQEPNFFKVSQVTVSGSNQIVDLSSLGTVGMVTVKRTDGTGAWYTWHRSLTSGKLVYLNTTNAETTDGSITLSGTNLTLVQSVIGNGAFTVYAWAHDSSTDGLIQCGSFTSTGSALSVNLGYEPQWLLFKPSSGAGDWNLVDNVRGFQVDRSGGTVGLWPSQTTAEASLGLVGPTSTGFTFNNGGSGVTSIYCAIRKAPMTPIASGTQVYKAIARTGTGATAAVTGVGFSPDMVLWKSRTNTWPGALVSKLRGADNEMKTSGTAQEVSTSGLTTFGMDGVTVGAANDSNANADTFIGYFFKRYPGVFDEVSWVATGTTQTVTHNLGVAPELIIAMDRSIGQTKPVGGTVLFNTDFLVLNSTAATSSSSNVWNNTSPTTTSFTTSGTVSWINNTGDNNTAYLFATKAGISKVGSYTGNGTSQTINAGFTGGAKFILIKRTDSTGDWYVWDSVRGINAGANDPHISLNTTVAEVTNDDSVDPANAGFIVKQNGATNVNVTGATYIYLAFSGDTPSTAPVITSPTVTSITNVSAVVGASLTSDGGASITSRGMCWGLSAAPTSCTSSGTATGTYTQTASSLIPGQTYYYRGFATNSVGTSYTTDGTFTAKTIPSVSLPTSASVSTSSAVLGATVTSDGGSTLLTRGTCFDTSPAPTINCVAEGGITAALFTHTRTNLPQGVTIYYRGYATNIYGTTYTSDGTFTMLPATTLATGSDLSTFNISPGSSATTSDTFTFKTDTGTDVITAVVLNLSNGTSTSLIEITNNAGSTVYGSTTNTATATTSITLSMNTLTATSTASQYRIRITPKARVSLATSTNYAVRTTIASWTSTNTNKVGTDTSNIVNVDNLGPSFNFGDGTFATKVDYTTASNPRYVTYGDFNADGKLDMAVANTGSNSVSILLGNGNGTFATKVDYPTGTGPRSVISADFNGDGKLDLAVASYTSARLSVLLGNGDGTFAAKVDYITGTGPVTVTSSDFNSDGKLDLAVTNWGSVSVSVLLGNGDGTFAAKVDYTTGTNPFSVTSTDFNADGKLDLAIANQGSDSVSILLGNGNGTFATKVDYTAGNGPRSVTSADLNSDGKIDLAVVNENSDSVSIFIGNGNGTFAAKVDYTAGNAPYFVTSSDFNGDGKLDLAVPNYNSTSVSIFIGNGNGTFATKVDYTTATNPSSVTSADFNADGKLDLAVGNYTSSSVSILLGNGTNFANLPANNQTTINYKTPSDTDLNSILVLTATSSITNTPISGTTYSVGNTIGTSTVGCIDTTTTPGVTSSCTITGLTNGTAYYFKVFAKDKYGNYGTGITPSTATATPNVGTTLATGSDLSTFNISPGSSATTSDTFTFKTDTGTDVITAVVVSLGNPTPVSLLEVTNNAGTVVYGSTTNPTGATTSITLSMNTLTATSTASQYRIRITPKARVSLATSTNYAVSTSIASWTGTNTNKAGTDTSNIVNVDNLGPSFNFGDGTFATKVDYVTGSAATSVVSGDFNSDGKLDLAVTNYTSSTVSIFIGNGDGTFASKVDYTTGTNPGGIASDDFNGDGKLDLAIGNINAATVSIFIGNGDGTFAAKVDYTTGSNPYSVNSADFNADGKLDLAVTNYVSNTISILLGNGNGTFAGKVDYAAGSAPRKLFPADLNGDGKLDLAVSNVSSNTVSIFIGNGDGTFAAKVDYTTGTQPYYVTSADFNADGKLDLAVANFSSNTISIFIGNGDGTFASKVDYAAGSAPRLVISNDFNSDGKLDLAVANWTSGTVSIFIGNGDGTFAAKVDYTTGTNPGGLTFADFNADGKLDLSAINNASNTVSILIGNGTNFANLPANNQTTINYKTPSDTDLNSILVLTATSSITNTPISGTTYSVGNTIGTSTVGCIDTTTTPGVTSSCTITGLTNGTAYYFKVFAKDKYGNYGTGITPSTATATPNVGTTLATGSDLSTFNISPGSSATTSDTFTFKTDTGTDVITAVVLNLSNATSTSLIEITNDAGTIVYGSTTNTGTATTSITLSMNTLTATSTASQYRIRITPKARVNVATSTNYAVSTSIASWTGTNTNKVGTDTSNVVNVDNLGPTFNNMGDGTFAVNLNYVTGSDPYSVTSADFNSDGKLDLAVANYGSNTVSVFIGNGNGTFATKVDYTTGASSTNIISTDLNADGKIDLAVTNYSSNTLSILMGNGDGTFATKVDYTTGTGPYSLTSYDFNSDGLLDFAVTNSTSSTVSIFMGNGNGTFTGKVDYTTGIGPRGVTSADFNGDGKRDLAVANYSSSTVSILMGNGNGTFATKVDYPIIYSLTTPQSIISGDFNGDNKVDIIITNINANTFSGLIGNGNGTFTETGYTANDYQKYGVVSADFNADGKPDLAMTGDNGTISIYDGDSIGSFVSNRRYTTTSTSVVYSIAPADFNGDGNLDLATVHKASSTFSILLGNGTTFTNVPANNQTTLTYKTPTATDLNSILVLRATSTITNTPVAGTTYSVGNTIGTSTVGCIDTTTTPGVTSSCTVTGLTNGTVYYFKVFAKDNSGNYGPGITPPTATSTPSKGTVLSTGSDPASFNIAPGATATTFDTFKFQTDTGTDTISSVVVNITNASSTSLIEITNDAGTVVYGSTTNPSLLSSVTISLTGLVASSTVTQYKIRVTPKARALLPANILYPVKIYIASWTGTNTSKSGTDTSNTVTIDKMPPATTSGGGKDWSPAASAMDNNWTSVAYGNGIFVAVASSSVGTRVMTSPDGVNWTIRTSASNDIWNGVTYGNGIFVAVSATGSGYRVMTSPDGVTWTIRATPVDNNWNAVTYGNGVFVAVAGSGTANRVMTSTDGITWTTRTSAADNNWTSVTYGNGMFVAVASSGSGNRVMTSPDGITWTSRSTSVANYWTSVTYGNGLFVAVSSTGVGNRVMTSPDGIVWSTNVIAPDNVWTSVTYGTGLFVAVSSDGTGNRVMTSSNGTSWTQQSTTLTPDNNWTSVTYGNGMFVAVANTGTGNRVMNSNSFPPAVTASNAKVIVSYRNPADLDLSSVLILMSSSSIVDAPVDGSTYTVSNTIGASTVACLDTVAVPSTSGSCTVTGLTNGTPYHFKVFAKDSSGNYSAGTVPTGSPVSPSSTASKVRVNSYRFIRDSSAQSALSVSPLASENTPVTSNFFVGDSTRLRIVISGDGTATTSMSYQLEYAKGLSGSTDSCTSWTAVPSARNATNQDFRIDPSSYVADGQSTSHFSNLTTAVSSKTFTPGTIQTFNNVTPAVSLGPNEFTELEYSVRVTQSAIPNVIYCFRLTNFGDPSDFTYNVIPVLRSGDKACRPQAGGCAGGGGGSLVPVAEVPVVVATTTVTGGGAAGGAGSSTEATSTPQAPQATTTPGGGGGGGGDVGLLNLGNTYAFNPYFINGAQGMVLGDSIKTMCTDMKHRMLYGVDDSTTQGQVSELQYYLKGTGYFNGDITGYFGSKTEEAVRQFQRDNNLIVTGIAGKVTRGKFSQLGCVKN